MLNLKPVAKIRTHLLVAAFIWSAVGIMLLTRGIIWLVASQWLLLMPVAVVAGTIKSKKVLDKIAGRNMDRILARQDGRCIGGVYSVKTWLLVLLMIGLGKLLRSSPVPLPIIGFLYVTVGWALFWSSRLVWLKWRQTPGVL